MADVYSRVETVSNAGATVATFGQNQLKHVINQADVGRELIISATKSSMTNDELTAARNQLTLAGGSGNGSDTNGPDAFTVAAIGTATGVAFESGTTGVVFIRLQGTGTPNLTTIGGVVLAKVAEFTPAL